MCNPSADRQAVQCVVVLLVVFTSAVIGVQKNSLSGRRATCSNEGEAVDVKSIDKSKCYECVCRNGYVECTKNCPRTEGCHMTEHVGCCVRCKGCQHNGRYYHSNTEFAYPEDPCSVYRCEAGVITTSKMQCYTPCANPLPPEPGKCCPTCPECKINGQIAYEDRDVISDDPCVKCRCSQGRMICSKKACPVLQCRTSFAIQPPGECCPRCRGTRSLITRPGTCIVQDTVVIEGQGFHIDQWTNCTCGVAGTSVCSRPSCPVLNCTSEFQESIPGSCCMRCNVPKENTESCVQAGKNYEDGESWQLDPCKSCKCDGGRISCAITRCNTTLSCPPGSKLEKSPGECCAKCVDVEGFCMVFGDPHYKTFDGKIYSFKGLGRYQLTKDCVNNNFSVRVYNHQQKQNLSSMTKRVAINYGRTRINLQQRGRLGRVKINGVQTRKFPAVEAGRFRVDRIDGNTEVILHNGVKLLWNGKSFLEVSVPAVYKKKLCGLCGNFNSNAQDDLTTSYGALLSDRDVQMFGNSWCAAKNKRECAKKIKVSNKYCAKHRTENHCKHLMSDVFAACHSKLDYSKYFKACKTDMCTCPDGNCYCDSLMAYARECQRLGVKLHKNQTYGLCYTATTRKLATTKKTLMSKSAESLFNISSNILRNRTPSHKIQIPIQ